MKKRPISIKPPKNSANIQIRGSDDGSQEPQNLSHYNKKAQRIATSMSASRFKKAGSKSPQKNNSQKHNYHSNSSASKRKRSSTMQEQLMLLKQKEQSRQESLEQERFREMHMNELVVKEKSKINMQKALGTISTKQLQYSWQNEASYQTMPSQIHTNGGPQESMMNMNQPAAPGGAASIKIELVKEPERDRDTHEQHLKTMMDKTAVYEQYMKTIIDKNNKLEERIEALAAENQKLKNEQEETREQNEELNDRLSKVLEENAAYREKDEIQKEKRRLKEQNKELLAEVEQLKFVQTEMEAKISQFKEKATELLQLNEQYNSELAIFNAENSKLKAAAKEQKQVIAMQQGQIEKLFDELERAVVDNGGGTGGKSTPTAFGLNIEEATFMNQKQRIGALEQEVEDSKLVIQELIDQLKDCDEQLREYQSHPKEQIEELRSRIDQLEKRKPVYIPHQRDAIDKAIAEYVNKQKRPQALVHLFQRESTGVYLINEKRVFVKIERCGKVQVRYAGKYQPLDEFVKEYGPTLEQMDSAARSTPSQLNLHTERTSAGNTQRDSSLPLYKQQTISSSRKAVMRKQSEPNTSSPVLQNRQQKNLTLNLLQQQQTGTISVSSSDVPTPQQPAQKTSTVSPTRTWTKRTFRKETPKELE